MSLSARNHLLDTFCHLSFAALQNLCGFGDDFGVAIGCWGGAQLPRYRFFFLLLNSGSTSFLAFLFQFLSLLDPRACLPAGLFAQRSCACDRAGIGWNGYFFLPAFCGSFFGDLVSFAHSLQFHLGSFLAKQAFICDLLLNGIVLFWFCCFGSGGRRLHRRHDSTFIC